MSWLAHRELAYHNAREYLQKKGISPLSVENRLTGIRSLYKSVDIIIPELPRSEEIAEPLKVHKGIPNKDDIRTVLEICDPYMCLYLSFCRNRGHVRNALSPSTLQYFDISSNVGTCWSCMTIHMYLFLLFGLCVYIK